jgi:histidyl-tRNA synthetase
VNQFTKLEDLLTAISKDDLKKENQNKIMKIQTPKGTRDFLPEEAINFFKLIGVVRKVFEEYGFDPIITPAFESFVLLAAKGGLGEAVKDEIYYFKDKSDRELGLRFDMTMPLARVISSNPQIPKPFKRYVIDKVWRYDNPQAMRWREFWQADIDVVGSNSVLADVECLAAVCKILSELGFKDYFIRVNSRKLLDNLLNKSVPENKILEVFRILDKQDKIGIEGVINELDSIGVEGKAIVKVITDKNIDISSFEGGNEIKELFGYAKAYGIDKRLKLDLSLVRGLEYYTGVVFEVYAGAEVSCGGGGRYDNLIEVVGGTRIPATGISLGLDRLFEVIKKKKMFEVKRTETKVFVANVDEKMKIETIKIVQRLRNKGVSCQTDLMNRNLSKQLQYADSLGIPYVVVVGEKEVKENKFKLKDMKKKTEKSLKLDEIIDIIICRGN